MGDRQISRTSEADDGGAHRGGHEPQTRPPSPEINWIPYTVNHQDGLRKLGQEAGVDWHAIYNKNREALHGKANLHQVPDLTIMVPDTVKRARAQQATKQESGVEPAGERKPSGSDTTEPGGTLHTIDKRHDSLHSLAESLGLHGKDAWKQIYEFKNNKELLGGRPNLKDTKATQIWLPEKQGRTALTPGRTEQGEHKETVAQLAPTGQTDKDPLTKSTIAPGHPDYIFAAPASPREKDGDGHNLHFTDGLNMPELEKLAKTDPASAKSVMEMRNALRVACNVANNPSSDNPKLGTPGAKDFIRNSFNSVYDNFTKQFKQDFGLSQTEEWKYLKEKGVIDPLAFKTDGSNPDYVFSSRTVDGQGNRITFDLANAKALRNVDGDALHMTDDINVNQLSKAPDEQNMLFSLRSTMRTFAQAQRQLGPQVLSEERTDSEGNKNKSVLERFMSAYQSFQERNRQDFGLSQTAEWRYLFPEQVSAER